MSTAEQEIEVNAIRTYPKRKVADVEISKKIESLWGAGKRFQILSGPPGVGKTLAAEDYIYQKVSDFWGCSPYESRLSNLFPDYRSRVYSDLEIQDVLASKQVAVVWELVVLHPQYTYEDLIRGYKVFSAHSGASLSVREGVLGFASRVTSLLETEAGSTHSPLGILVLDEINRAPIGQLFGEAIYALDRRGDDVSTPYELDGYGSNISIPESLLILGTMNSVDRATAGFDYALRRRFANVSVEPSDAPIQYAWSKLDSWQAKVGPTLYLRVKQLLEGADSTGMIPTRELMLGPAFFLPPDNILLEADAAVNWMVMSYQHQILPALMDYAEQGLVDYSGAEVALIPFGETLLLEAQGPSPADSEVFEEFQRLCSAGD